MNLKNAKFYVLATLIVCKNKNTGKIHTVEATVNADSATMHNNEHFCGTFASVEKHRKTIFYIFNVL